MNGDQRHLLAFLFALLLARVRSATVLSAVLALSQFWTPQWPFVYADMSIWIARCAGLASHLIL